ncbi:MAG: hypothetical protein AAFQ89_02865 [Cyanobacteria bacterium J06626_18]
MSYPSFKSYIKTLGGLLKIKGNWLLKESKDLAKLCSSYGKTLNLTSEEKKSLLLAAYFKNLGAIYLSDYLLDQEFRDHSTMTASMNIWFAASKKVAQDAGLEEVATILAQYHLREVPQHRLARIFQVLNTWVACQQQKGWGKPMSIQETKLILEQRAQLQWSDPSIVGHFLECCDQQEWQSEETAAAYA